MQAQAAAAEPGVHAMTLRYFNCGSKNDELVLSCKLNEGSIATHSNITRRIPELCSNRLI